MSVQSKQTERVITRREADEVIHLEHPGSVRVISVEEAEPQSSGIPIYVRQCFGCGSQDLNGDWYFGPDRDLGVGWACPTCGDEDHYGWSETALSNVSGRSGIPL